MRSALALAFAAAVLPACALDDDADDGLGEFADESERLDDGAGKADELGTYDYFLARRDVRRCASPDCGGVWIDRVNRVKTRCPDGVYRAECYVGDLDVAALGYGEAEQGALETALIAGRALLRGSVRPQADGDRGGFLAAEAWSGAGQAEPAGTFSRIDDSGIRCITTPCGSLTERKLNSALSATIAELDFEPSAASALEIDAAVAAIGDGVGLIVAGYRYTARGPAGRAKARDVNAFYARIAAAPPSSPCVVTGCSGQACAEETVFTTCEWRPEYACYADAACERQADGECGWTETPALDACLADPPQPQ